MELFCFVVSMFIRKWTLLDMCKIFSDKNQSESGHINSPCYGCTGIYIYMPIVAS